MKNRLFYCIWFAAMIGLFVTSQACGEIKYTIIDLGGLGGNFSEPYSINDYGKIVGRATNTASELRPVIFDETGNGNNVDIGFSSVTKSQDCAYSINNKAKVVGQATYYVAGFNHYWAVIFNSSGKLPLGTLGGFHSNAYSINEQDQIAGEAMDSAQRFRATLFDPTGNGNNIDLGGLSNGSSSAWAINEKGHSVGYAYNSLDKQRATLFDPTGGGKNIDLGSLGGSKSWAKAINENDQIVGNAYDSGELGKATLFDPTGNGNNLNLSTLGGYWSDALAINDKGQIVGWAYDPSNKDSIATFFDSTGGGNNIDLNSLIDPNSKWILKQAMSINNLGQICGWGSNSLGNHRAFLLTPIRQPAPPNADAGEDKTLFASFTGTALVPLNGSNSSDPDGNKLTYKWSWIIDAHSYDADGVSPTIELPIGSYIIQLIVNNGLIDSQPDDVNIAVIPALKSNLKMSNINLRNIKSDVRAYLEFPSGIDQNAIDVAEPFVFYPGEITAMKQEISSGRITAFFDKTELANKILTDGSIEVSVEGKLKSGQYFYGSDIVRINH